MKSVRVLSGRVCWHGYRRIRGQIGDRSPTGQGCGKYEITRLQSGFTKHRVLDRNWLAFVQTVAEHHERAFDT